MPASSREIATDVLGNPSVSVILPTYNRAHLVGRAIRSVLDQTWQDFEIIVVDDASIDNTEQVVKSFSDPCICYICHEKNRGAAAARNTGIGAARGKYLAFQDSDDEWSPEKLEKQLAILDASTSRVGVVYSTYCLSERADKKNIPDSNMRSKEGNIHGELLKGNFIGTPTAIAKRVCFEKMGPFDPALPALEDWELWIRFSKSYEFRFIDEPLVYSHRTRGSISTDRSALIRAHMLILEKHSQDFRRDRRLLASHQYLIGNLLCQSGEMGQGRDWLLKAVKSYPLNIKYLVAAFVSLFGENAYAKAARLKRRLRPVD